MSADSEESPTPVPDLAECFVLLQSSTEKFMDSSAGYVGGVTSEDGVVEAYERFLFASYQLEMNLRRLLSFNEMSMGRLDKEKLGDQLVPIVSSQLALSRDIQNMFKLATDSISSSTTLPSVAQLSEIHSTGPPSTTMDIS